MERGLFIFKEGEWIPPTKAGDKGTKTKADFEFEFNLNQIEVLLIGRIIDYFDHGIE